MTAQPLESSMASATIVADGAIRGAVVPRPRARDEEAKEELMELRRNSSSRKSAA